jgi:hypothetical protein
LIDSKGNTWVPRTEYGVSTDRLVRTFYALNPTVGSGHTFTYDTTGLAPSIAVIAVRSDAGSAAFDQENGATTTTVATTQPGSVTPSENGELLVAGYSGYSQGIVNNDLGADFVMLGREKYNGTAMTVGLAIKKQATAAAINPTWTLEANAANVSNIATFEAVAAAAGGPIIFPKRRMVAKLSGLPVQS